MSKPSPIPDAPGAADLERAARLMAVAERLIDIGMELAEALPRDLAEGRLGIGAAALAYERIARAVRLGVMLTQRLEAGIEVVDVARPVERLMAARPLGVESERPEREERFELEREPAERGDPDESVWMTRPIWMLAAKICGDLRLPYDAAFWEDGGDGGSGGPSGSGGTPRRPAPVGGGGRGRLMSGAARIGPANPTLRTLPPRGGKGRVGGERAEGSGMALFGAGTELGSITPRPASTPIPPLPPSRGKAALLTSASQYRPP